MSRLSWVIVAFLMFLAFMFATLGGCATTRPYEPEQPAMTCPEGTRFDLRNGVCESVCSQGEKWDTATKGCESICNPGFLWSSRESSCVSVCKGETSWDGLNNACVCPAGKFPTATGLCLTKAELQCEADKAHKAVIERAATMKVQFDAEDAARSKCKNGTKWDISVSQCVSICKGGTWNDAQATCLCPQGKEWIPIFGECVVPQKLIDD